MREQPFWTDAIFSLVTPDAIRRHLLRPIVHRFRAEGLAVAAFRVTDITTVHMDGMYEQHLVNTADAYRYRALDARMALGPAVALRLVPPGDGTPIRDWYARVKHIKGPSAPAEAPPGSLRHDLGAVNTILSLLHCADSPASAVRESALMLGGPAHTLSWQDGAALDPLVDVLEAAGAVETRGFCEVVSEIRASVAFRLWGDLDDDGRALVTKLIGTGSLCAAGAGEQVREHLAAGARSGPLAGILAQPFDPSTPPVDVAWVRRQLAAAGIGFDDWTGAVLASSMYFPPRRRGVTAGPAPTSPDPTGPTR
jgi:nucleoside diphosphate kinase